MALDRPLSDHQLTGDLPVGQALRDQDGDLTLSARQLHQGVRWDGGGKKRSALIARGVCHCFVRAEPRARGPGSVRSLRVQGRPGRVHDDRIGQRLPARRQRSPDRVPLSRRRGTKAQCSL